MFGSKKRKIEEARAGEIFAVIKDTYEYLKEHVAKPKEIQSRVNAGHANKAIFQSIVGEYADKVEQEKDGWIELGQRNVNLKQGLALEQEWEALKESIKRESEFQQAKKLAPFIEARLDVWQEATTSTFPVYQSQSVRDRHTYIVGKSGSGKTTLLTFMIWQDMMYGHGVAYICPDRETIEDELMPYIPPNRLGDVIYFNPADEKCKHSFNPLHLGEGEDVDQKVDDVFTSFSRLMEGEGSPRINEILRQTFYALIETPGATLLDIPRLLDKENPHYRKQIISQLKDEQTKQFWSQTYESMPVNVHLPILSRISQFIRPRRIRNILCRVEKGLDFREIMDSGKILLCNLSDGLLGEHASRLLGGLVMSEIQLATMSRADTIQSNRKRFYVYVDEFQSFVSHGNVSYDKLLSRARKYRLPLILAHQQTGQIPRELVREIFGNVSTLICFLVNREDAQYISREMILDSSPDMKTASPEELITQEIGEAHVKIGTMSFPMHVTRYLSKELTPNWDKKEILIKVSQRQEESQAGDVDDIPADPFGDDLDPQEVF